MIIKPQLFDTVELIRPLPEHNVAAGIRAVLAHQYDDDTFDLEVVDDKGWTEAVFMLSAKDFIVVWCNETGEYVSEEDKVAQIVARLPESKKLSVFDFARFLVAAQPADRLDVVYASAD